MESTPKKQKVNQDEIPCTSGFFSQVPNFRFIRESSISKKKRIRVNFHHFFIFLNNCVRYMVV
jgi:hypothetical protein